jgi:Protein of unknown function (DUF3810)
MKKSKIILSVFLVIQIIALKIVSFFPEFIEEYYSNGLYLFISKISRTVFGSLNFSIGDLIYLILILILIWHLFKNRKRFFAWKAWKLEWKNNFLSILSFVSVFYFMFNLLWGLNYHRVPLYEKMTIDKEYTLAELMSFTKKMIAKTNAIHSQIEKNDSLKILSPYSVDTIYSKTQAGYATLGNKYSFFKYENPSIKKSLVSLPLTYMGFGGYLNPFTNEAQVNYMIPKYNFPTTVCHEMAHQIGYASESEANFIGYLASINNKDIYFQYSGYSYALKYCLSNLEKIEEGKSKELLPLIHPGILKNFQESKDFWDSYQTPIDTFFHYFYDNFLKLNQQKDGLESYSKFVGLMIGYYRSNTL